MIEVKEFKLPEVWEIKLDQNVDYRGSYMTVFTEDLFKKYTGETVREANLVDNRQYTFRGYHYSPHSWKLYLCLDGVLHYYLVNWDKAHENYGKCAQITLLPYQGFIKHPRYATGMWAITKSKLLVLQSQVYDPSNPDQETIEKGRLNNELGAMGENLIFYPNLPMIMSERDMVGEYIRN